MLQSCTAQMSSLEDEIWKAAERLRGNIDPSQYKNVILSLIFLRFVSDIEQDDAQRIHVVIPPASEWTTIAQASNNPRMGAVVDKALRTMARNNPLLASALTPPFSLTEIDSRRLGNLVEVLDTAWNFNGCGSRDVLGDIYEYCLDRFASIGGRSTGEFYTPSCVVELLVDLIEPFEGCVYDPCCGSGGMFVQSARFIEQHAGDLTNVSLYGQESNPVTWSIAYMNLALRGLVADLGPGHADTLNKDIHPGKKFDFILANPPFNLKNWGSDVSASDARWIYGTPPDGNANFAWLQHMLSHLSSCGRMGVVLTNGSLSSKRNGEGDIRRAIIEDDLIEGIVTLPGHLFSSTAISVSLWILNKNKNQPGKTLFIDAQKRGKMISCRQKVLTELDIHEIHEVFNAFRRGDFIPQQGFSTVATIDEIAQCEYSLVPGRYIDVAYDANNVCATDDFQESMFELHRELKDLFHTSHALEAEINDTISSLGLAFDRDR